jgi:protocatechuate 3,4-dioxygenase beta subunit
MTTRSTTRRRILGLFAAAPIGAALAGCSDTLAMLGPDASLADGGLGDAGRGDAGMASSDAGVCEPTQRDALGPFYENGAPSRMTIATASEPGERVLIEGQLVDASDCVTPLRGYVIDVWQADAEGNYYRGATSDYRLRGRITTGADGRFAFESIKPGFYETGAGPRPAHFHARVFTPGGNDRLVTQLYFAGDPYLGRNDGCQPPTCFSDDPARILRLEPARIGGVNGLRGAVRLIVPA